MYKLKKQMCDVLLKNFNNLKTNYLVMIIQLKKDIKSKENI